jgi:hypothetical protein
LLEFQDGSHWIARVQMLKSSPDTIRTLRNEIDIIGFLITHTKALVPQIFAFELNDQNLTMSSFVLLEFFPGNTAIDEARHYDITDGGLIPEQFWQPFYFLMAATHVSSLLIVKAQNLSNILLTGSNCIGTPASDW